MTKKTRYVGRDSGAPSSTKYFGGGKPGEPKIDVQSTGDGRTVNEKVVGKIKPEFKKGKS